MRVVIDSNRLRSEELRWFLGSAPDNSAVITDYAWMEAYKANSVTTISESLSILVDFPSQVLPLRGTKAISALDPRTPGLSNRMIIPRAQAEFIKTASAIKSLREGDLRAVPSILAHGVAAKEQIDKVTQDAEGMAVAFKGMEALFDRSEIKTIRTSETYPPSVVEKVLGAADYTYSNFRKAHPDHPKQWGRALLPNSFMWRFALGAIMHVVTWIRHGSQTNRRVESVRNDMIDLNFAVYGTFFNGIMTSDKRLQDFHIELRTVLKGIGGRLVEPYDPTSYLLVA